MKKNRVKKAMEDGKTVIGTMIVETRTPEIPRMMAAAGFDFVFIDTEHATYDLDTVKDMIRAGKASGLTCLVRVPDAEYHLIARTLDAGAQGVMVPRVEDRETVERIVRAAKYPPWGERGYGPRPIITDYQQLSMKERIAELNEDTVIVIQVERKKAIEDIDDLLSIKGVDVALIGPNDLSISLGVPGDINSEPMIDAIQKVVDACEKRHIASGIHVPDMETLLFWKRRGMRMLTYSTEANMLLSSATQAVNEIRKQL